MKELVQSRKVYFGTRHDLYITNFTKLTYLFMVTTLLDINFFFINKNRIYFLAIYVLSN